MQSARFACLLLITSTTSLLASDKETPPTTTVGKKRSYDEVVATAALSQAAENRDLMTPGRPYHLSALEQALIIPTVHDRPQAPATPYSDANLRKPGTWYLVEDSSFNDGQWCSHHDRDGSCNHCTRC